MILIIGGAYQGKTSFARREFGLAEEDIFTCCGGKIDFSRRCVDALEVFTRSLALAGEDPVDYFRQREAALEGKIFVCREIGCGVVPMDEADRRWRQDTGRLCQYLAERADRVSRIFCGLEQRLK